MNDSKPFVVISKLTNWNENSHECIIPHTASVGTKPSITMVVKVFDVIGSAVFTYKSSGKHHSLNPNADESLCWVIVTITKEDCDEKWEDNSGESHC